ncbi:hypothetical protein NPIL_630341 [Nephila pilipes]|uniref:Uncharacterized protein n=1 Tax=Nephila pilipes TaxID=299642 RepID=A0A8X6PMK7_NEPPI|nr:hypothetical protein NPIL_630341 [Nephila pilipes]
MDSKGSRSIHFFNGSLAFQAGATCWEEFCLQNTGWESKSCHTCRTYGGGTSNFESYGSGNGNLGCLLWICAKLQSNSFKDCCMDSSWIHGVDHEGLDLHMLNTIFNLFYLLE